VNQTTNPYLPSYAQIIQTKEENSTIKSFLLELPETIAQELIMPGQFFQLSIPGYGEAPISVSEINEKTLLFCVANMGSFTQKIHTLGVGDKIGLRGPYGNGFPISASTNSNLVLLAGGIGLVPLRSVVSYFFHHQDNFKNLEILYGAKSSNDIIYRDDIKQWRHKSNTIFKLTIDKPEKDWNGNTGFVTQFLNPTTSDPSEVLFHLDKNFSQTKIFVVGPPMMLNSVYQALAAINFPAEHVFVSLENRMKCGIGKCGHCNAGSQYVCLDGPVFSWKTLQSMPDEY
jgi:NAD(P)H-flavin reductase